VCRNAGAKEGFGAVSNSLGCLRGAGGRQRRTSAAKAIILATAGRNRSRTEVRGQRGAVKLSGTE